MASTEQHTGVRFPWVRPAQSADAESGADSAEAVALQADELQADELQESIGTPDGTDDGAAQEARASGSPEWPSTPTTHKPSRFLGELVRAMLAAAQEARSGAVEQVHADAKTHIETIHGRSAERAAELKQEADDDNAATREWSKSEIARIREETEERIAARKDALAADLERHAALIEAEIDAVQKRVAAFEQEVEAFFARLSESTDPTQLAQLAERMPDPPQFDDAATATLDNPARDEADAEVEAMAPDASAESADEPAAPDRSGFTDTTDDDAGDATAEREGAGATDQAAAAETVTEPDELEAEAEEPVAGAEGQAAETVDGQAEADATDSGAADATTAEASVDESIESDEASGDVLSAEDAEAQATIEAAVESEETAGEPEATIDTAEPSDDAGPAERLAHLISTLPRPGDMGGGQNDRGASDPSVNSVLAVVGLVSVAGIASFKRQLAHVPGVFSVGVSSSPDGEFVFRVAHDRDVALRDVVPALPGFAARVIKEADGRLSVSAHDPTNEG